VARWIVVEEEAPDLVALARRYLDAHVHKTLATLRRDGSPRISGIELTFADGDAWLGMMWQSSKARDLRRDARFALHSGSDDPPAWTGDATLSGTAREVDDPAALRSVYVDQAPAGPAHLFRLDVTALSVVRLGDPADHLVVETWREGKGLSRVERR
jgi:hypothetical protein